MRRLTGLMQAIHFPIGVVEGVVTGIIAALASVVDRKKLSYTFAGISVILAGVISQYASQKPDGLEWSLLNISDSVVMQTQGVLYNISEVLQAKMSIFANMPYTSGSLAGLAVVAAIVYLFGLRLSKNLVDENAK